MPDSERPDTTVYKAPHARSFTDWTPDDLRAADALAQSGNLRMAADLCRWVLGDSRVRAALETRVKGMLALPLSFEESGDGRRRGRVVRALEADEDFYNACSEAALYRVISRGILLGVGLAQKVYVTTARGRVIPVLKPYDERWLRWDVPSRRWMVQTDDLGEIEMVPGSKRWMLYAPSCAGIPTGDQCPWDDGAWRCLRKPALLKDLAHDDWGHHSQLHGSGIRTAEIELTAAGKAAVEKDARREIAEQLGDLGGDASMVPPAGVKLGLLEAKARTWEMFPAQISSANLEIAVGITGQNLSTEVTAGVGTGANLHKSIRQDLIDSDAKTASSVLREQVLCDWAELNFGARELAPWPLWQTEPPEDITARGQGMSALAAGIRAVEAEAPAGMTVDRTALFERAGIPLVEISDANPKPAAAAPAPPPKETLP